MKNFLFELLLLFGRHVEHLHFPIKLLPILFFLLLLQDEFGISQLDKTLCSLDFSSSVDSVDCLFFNSDSLFDIAVA